MSHELHNVCSESDVPHYLVLLITHYMVFKLELVTLQLSTIEIAIHFQLSKSKEQIKAHIQSV